MKTNKHIYLHHWASVITIHNPAASSSSQNHVQSPAKDTLYFISLLCEKAVTSVVVKSLVQAAVSEVERFSQISSVGHSNRIYVVCLMLVVYIAKTFLFYFFTTTSTLLQNLEKTGKLEYHQLKFGCY